LTVNVGVIGAGWVATDRHLPALKRAKNANIVAVFDRNSDRAGVAARKYGAREFHASVDGLLDQQIDAVVICTPPQAHFELITQSLEAGKHVLVEKPFTLIGADGEKVAALAAAANLIVAPSHNFLYANSTRRAKQLIESGRAGAVISASGVQLSSWNRRLPTWYDDLPGGLFFDEAPHLLYLMREFVGELDVATAWRDLRNAPNGQPVERTEAQLVGERGDATLSMITGAPLSEWYVTLVCEKKILIIDLFRDIMIDLPAETAHNRKDVLGVSLRTSMQHWVGTFSSGLRVLRGKGDYGHGLLVSQFIDAVEGAVEPPTTAEDGTRVVQLMESILEKAE
jgi:scyllo-inositol 2-dehydrogenase (NADP+)